MQYVTCMGGLWRLSERSYRRMLKDVVKGCVQVLDAQHAEIERGLSRYANQATMLVRVADVLYPR